VGLETTAYHEAGHAVADHVLGFNIRSVTIAPSKGCAGKVSGKLGVKPRILEYGNPSRATVTKWHDKVVTLLAGAEAQRRFKPHSIRRYMARGDHNAAVDILFRLHPEEEELNAAIKFLEARTRNLVGNAIRWGQIEALAGALMAKRTLTGQEVRQVLVASHERQCRQGQAAHAGGA
jgi:hypothetical protein